MTTSTTAALQTFDARTPEDVLAAVPIVLGFAPEESVVMLTFGSEHPFHARLDLPDTEADRLEAARALVGPALRHGVDRVLFVLYTDDAELAVACAAVLDGAFTGAGIEVVDALRSDGRCWFRVPGEGDLPGVTGTPYDVSGHLFTAESVASGRVTRSSRAELAATVAADDSARDAVAQALLALDPQKPLLDGLAVRTAVAQWAAGLGPPDPASSARLLSSLREAAVRDAVLTAADREQAERQLAVWSALVRSAPPDVVAPAASVLAFLAWLAGNGALAWCAVERAAEGDPPCSLADRVAEALEQALPPAVWDQRR